jgi:hypothetical protein
VAATEELLAAKTRLGNISRFFDSVSPCTPPARASSAAVEYGSAQLPLLARAQLQGPSADFPSKTPTQAEGRGVHLDETPAARRAHRAPPFERLLAATPNAPAAAPREPFFYPASQSKASMQLSPGQEGDRDREIERNGSKRANVHMGPRETRPVVPALQLYPITPKPRPHATVVAAGLPLPVDFQLEQMLSPRVGLDRSPLQVL